MMRSYGLNIVGHSLGAGVATLLTIFLIEKIEVLGGINSDSIQCFAIAPPRVLSLNLAKKYASNVNSVIYQVCSFIHILFQIKKKTRTYIKINEEL